MERRSTRLERTGILVGFPLTFKPRRGIGIGRGMEYGMRTNELPLSDDDKAEMANFADLLRARAGLAPTGEMPRPVCLLTRPGTRTGYSKDSVPHE